MRKVVLIAILFIGSLASAGALELRGFAPSFGGMGIVALVRDDGRYANSPLKFWFDRLASGNGLCCSFADAVRSRPSIKADNSSRMRCEAGNLVVMGCSFAGPAKARC